MENFYVNMMNSFILNRWFYQKFQFEELLSDLKNSRIKEIVLNYYRNKQIYMVMTLRESTA